MGKIIARNMLSRLELLINRHCCIYLVVYIILSVKHGHKTMKYRDYFDLMNLFPFRKKNRRPNEKQQHQRSTAALNAGCKWSQARWRHLSNSFVGFTTDQHHSLISGLTRASSAKRLTVENELVSCFSPSVFWDLLFYSLSLLTVSVSFLLFMLCTYNCV